MKRSLKVIGATLLSVPILFSSYLLGKNEPERASVSPKTKKEQVERLSPEQLKQMRESYEQVITRINKDIMEVVNKTLVNQSERKSLHNYYDINDKVLKEENFVFRHETGAKEREVKTCLGFKLGKTRDLESITTDITYQNFRVQTNYNAQKNEHTIKGNANLAGIDARVVLNSTRRPVISAAKTMKVGRIINLSTSGAYNFENKNAGLGLAGSIKDYFGASVSTNHSPLMSIIDYSVNGDINNVVKINLHSRETSRPGNPDSMKRTYDSNVTTKLNKNTTFQAGLMYADGRIANYSFQINYTLKK